MSQSPYISRLLEDYIKLYGSQFKKVEYIKDPIKENKNIPEYANFHSPEFLIKRKSVSETMNIINSHREGDMLLWEDDIIVPNNAYQILNEIYNWSDKFYGVTCVQYNRGFGCKDTLLLWDWEQKKVFGDNDSSKEVQYCPKVRMYHDERKSGIEFVGSTATGFIIYKDKFLNQHSFGKDGIWGQDVLVGKHINDLGGKLVLCWDIKSAHLGTDEDGRFKIFRSNMCKTEVIDEDGIRF